MHQKDVSEEKSSKVRTSTWNNSNAQMKSCVLLVRPHSRSSCPPGLSSAPCWPWWRRCAASQTRGQCGSTVLPIKRHPSMNRHEMRAGWDKKPKQEILRFKKLPNNWSEHNLIVLVLSWDLISWIIFHSFHLWCHLLIISLITSEKKLVDFCGDHYHYLA